MCDKQGFRGKLKIFLLLSWIIIISFIPAATAIKILPVITPNSTIIIGQMNQTPNMTAGPTGPTGPTGPAGADALNMFSVFSAPLESTDHNLTRFNGTGATWIEDSFIGSSTVALLTDLLDFLTFNKAISQGFINLTSLSDYLTFNKAISQGFINSTYNSTYDGNVITDKEYLVRNYETHTDLTLPRIVMLNGTNGKIINGSAIGTDGTNIYFGTNRGLRALAYNNSLVSISGGTTYYGSGALMEVGGYFYTNWLGISVANTTSTNSKSAVFKLAANSINTDLDMRYGSILNVVPILSNLASVPNLSYVNDKDSATLNTCDSHISTNTSASGGNNTYSVHVQALTSSPADSVSNYFGMLPKAPSTSAGTNRIYVRYDGFISGAAVTTYSGTAGTSEAWPLYISKQGDTGRSRLVSSVSAAANERVFYNTTLNIPVTAGQYFEMRFINPAWSTNPLTTVIGGTVFMNTSKVI